MAASTGTGDLQTARVILADLVARDHRARKLGERPEYTFQQAATKYVEYNDDKKTLRQDISHLDRLIAFGDLANVPLSKFHRGTLDPFVAARQKERNSRGQLISHATINHALAVVRHLLNQAASDWRDEHGLTWLAHAPKIRLLSNRSGEAFTPHPLTWSEQELLFATLPDYLQDMALFAVNTGARDGEICNLSWDWLVPVPQLNTEVFRLPEEYAKNGRARVIVMNSLAREVIRRRREERDRLDRDGVFVRNESSERFDRSRVFTRGGKTIARMSAKAWQTGRASIGMRDVRVHDLRHTTGYRLEDAGVPAETISEVLGHVGKTVTDRYTAAGLRRLLEAVERIVPGADAAHLDDVIVLRL